MLSQKASTANAAGQLEVLGMKTLMDVKCSPLFEGFSTDFANVRPLSGMGTSMLVPGGLRGQTTATDVTFELLHSFVNVLNMSIQTRSRSESLPAHVAPIRSLSGMSIAVRQEVVRSGHNLRTVLTFVVRGSVDRDLRPGDFQSLLRRVTSLFFLDTSGKKRPSDLRVIIHFRVIEFLMINQVSLLAKGEAAEFAFPGFFVRVHQPVALQFVF